MTLGKLNSCPQIIGTPFGASQIDVIKFNVSFALMHVSD